MPSATSPPGPHRPFGLDGRAFRRDPLGFLTRLARRHGDIAAFRVGAHQCVLLNRPDDIRDVLVTNHQTFTRGGIAERRSPVLGEGLLTIEGDRHHRHRQLIRPAFHRDRIRALAGVIVTCGERFAAKHWRAGDTREILPDMRRLSLDVMMRALFGPDGAREDLTSAMASAIDRIGRFGARPSRLGVRLPRPRGGQPPNKARAIAELDAPILRLLAERRKTAIDHGDMLSTLIGARDADGALSDEDVRDEVRTLLEAGHIAVGNALAWTWYLIASDPALEAALHAEWDAVLGSGAATLDDVPRLVITEQVWLESLRLYPPAWLISRRAVRDCVIGGHAIVAGTSVVICPFVTHRDARYFPDPDRVNPGRWTPEARQARPSHAFLAFSYGPQRCIGEGLAHLEGVLLLATLGRYWRAGLTSGRPPAAVPLMTLVPDLLRLRVMPRTRADEAGQSSARAHSIGHT